MIQHGVVVSLQACRFMAGVGGLIGAGISSVAILFLIVSVNLPVSHSLHIFRLVAEIA